MSVRRSTFSFYITIILTIIIIITIITLIIITLPNSLTAVNIQIQNFNATLMCLRSIAGVLFDSAGRFWAYYCTPLVCVLNGLRGLAAWWLYKQKNTQHLVCRCIVFHRSLFLKKCVATFQALSFPLLLNEFATFSFDGIEQFQTISGSLLH